MIEKYSLKDSLLKADDELKGSLSLMGMTMLTHPTYNNSMRSVMFTSHLKQFVNLEKPDFPGFFTNGENVVGDHSSGYKKAKHDLTVYRKIEKYAGIIDTPYVYTLFVYDEKKKEYDIITRQDCENLTEVFGYNYDNEVIDSLSEGDYVEKGTVLYKSQSYDEYMNYGYGKNVTMMYTSDPYTSEDACIAAESLASEMVSTEINKVPIGINNNEILLNKYGDEENYKPFPDLGEWTDGNVATKRMLNTEQFLTDCKDTALYTNNDSDICYYSKGKVVDIDIYCNNPELEDTPFTHQIMKYLDAQTEYYRDIKETCEEIMSSGEKYTHELDYLYKRACEFLDPESRWKDNDSLFSNLLITITVKNPSQLQIGQKLSGRYGNKSVISKIVPDDEMPYYYDDNGNKVVIKLLFNILAIINRTTAFPIYELSINFICNKVRAQLVNMKTLKEKEDLLFGIVNDFNEDQAAEMRVVYKGLSSKKEKEAYINDCISERIFIHQRPMWETKPIFFRLLDIYKKYDFLTPYDLYINKWGREIKMLNPGYIGEMYIIKLKQTSRKGFSARATGSVNAKGLPERSYKNKSFTELHSSTPIRFGEYETLNFSIGLLPEDIQLFHLLYRTSVKARRELAEHLLDPLKDDDFNISTSYTSRVAEIFDVILKSLGLRLEFINEDNEIKEYDDEIVREYEIDGVPYLATEYQFMLTQRRKDIEAEVLAKYGVIDSEDFEAEVMAELMTRNFVIGPDKSEYPTTPGFKPDTVI